jgi:hypothetical protein
MRQCTRCPFRGEDSEFGVKTRSKANNTGVCKACKAQYNASWYGRNKEQHIENVQKNNQKYSRGTPKRRRSSDPVKARARKLKAFLDGKCTTCESRPFVPGRRSCEVCSDRSRALARERRVVTFNLPNIVLQDMRGSDRKKGRANDLTLKFVQCALAQPCSYCGDTASRMTLDRIDNSTGHLQANVRPSCMRCNYIRGSMPDAAWETLIPSVRSAFENGLFGEWHGPRSPRKMIS